MTLRGESRRPGGKTGEAGSVVRPRVPARRPAYLGRMERWCVRAFRSLLLAYPPEFRAAYGRELCLVFADRCRERTTWPGLVAVWLQALGGLALAAPQEHYHMIVQDLRYACRMLRKSPVTAAVTVAVLALGIGATTVAFSLANGLLLRPLPYPHPESLVAVDESAPQRNDPSKGVAFPNYEDFRARNHTLAGIALYDSDRATLAGSADAVRIPSADVSAGLFPVLGVRPLLGRTFLPEEDTPRGPAAVLLGERVWRERFAADSSLVGRSIRVNGAAKTVVGVMPAGFHFPDQAEVWLPLRMDAKLSPRTDHNYLGIGRLRPGVEVAQADQELKATMRQIARENPLTYEGQTVNVLPFRLQITSSYRTAVLTLLGAVLCVLLIACANIANLLLVQAADRSREIAVRGALGASRGRVARQLVIESLLLGGVGAAAGLALAAAGTPLLLALIPIELPRWMHFGVDLRVLLFTAGISMATSLLVSLAPAHLCSRLSLTETLKEGGRGGMTGRRSERIRHALVVGEVALSVSLLVAGGLMARSFLALHQAPAGFDARHVLTLRVWAPRVKYDNPEKRRDLVRRERAEVAGLPGVVSVAAAVSGIPLADAWGRSLTVEGSPLLSLREAPMINHVVATPGYFKTLGVPLVAGRDFTEADGTAALVTIVDQDLARRYWPNASPLGKHVRFGPPEDDEPWHTVVGVAGAVRNQTLQLPGRATVYLAHGEISFQSVSLILRTAGDPLHSAAAVRNRIARVDRDLAVSEVRSLEQVVEGAIWQPRFFAALFVAFAALALLLAAVGLYGVMSYAVSRRRRELGLRAALGASPGVLRGLVLGQALRLSLAGLAVGGVFAVALTRALASQLYEVQPTDPGTYGAMAALLLAVAIAASSLPASQAVRSDPMDALREE
ncbi:MAG TPA: ABC transporter permease [Thermoanaerobaculia bacterium]|nr:ABC transporter permease [Thermoanaerobaculia bacterium]